jgi:hypothetical protein
MKVIKSMYAVWNLFYNIIYIFKSETRTNVERFTDRSNQFCHSQNGGTKSVSLTYKMKCRGKMRFYM